MNQTLKAHISMLATTLIFGIHYTIAKGFMPDAFSPKQLLFLRMSGGVLLFWIFQKLFVPEKVERKDLFKFALCGLFGFALNQMLFYEGLNLTSPVDASLIHLLNPVLVLIFAHLLIGERITILKISGIVLGASGALVLVLSGRHTDFSRLQATGNILVLLNMVFYALYLVLIKPLVGKYHTTTILKWVSFFGFIFILPVTVRPALETAFDRVTLTEYLGLAYVIIINTFVAYLLINFSLKHLTPGTVSYYNYLQPFIASVMSVSIGQSAVTPVKILAAVLIFAGVFLVNRRGIKTAERK